MKSEPPEVRLGLQGEEKPSEFALNDAIIKLRTLANELELRHIEGRTSEMTSGAVIEFIGRDLDSRLIEYAKLAIKTREARAKFFPTRDLFGEPAWDMLLDLIINTLTKKNISISSLCIASRVPSTTALRWIAELERVGFAVRKNDSLDRRRSYIEATPLAIDSFRKYFEAIYGRYLTPIQNSV